MPCTKTTRVDRSKLYNDFLLPRLEMFLNFHLREGYRDQTHSFTRNKRAFLKSVWISLPKLKNRTLPHWLRVIGATEITWIRSRKLFCRTCQVTRTWIAKISQGDPVDEHKTSKLHNYCHQKPKKIYREKRWNDDLRRNVKIHSVLFCSHQICCGIVMNRDVNASCNILQLLKSFFTDGTRPDSFCRNSIAKFCFSGISSSETGRPMQGAKVEWETLLHPFVAT